jgi:hypothetical protein
MPASTVVRLTSLSGSEIIDVAKTKNSLSGFVLHRQINTWEA